MALEADISPERDEGLEAFEEDPPSGVAERRSLRGQLDRSGQAEGQPQKESDKTSRPEDGENGIDWVRAGDVIAGSRGSGRAAHG